MERYVTIEGRRVRVGTYADAGRLCDGVSGETYRRYASGRATLAVPAPGPLTIADPTDPTGQRRMPLLDPDTRAAQVDLDAVERWHAGRAGERGRRGHRSGEITPELLRRTPGRVELLVAARDGELQQARVGDHPGATLVKGEARSRRVGQLRAELQQLGLLSEPIARPDAGYYYDIELTDEGRRVLTRWGIT